MDEKNIREELAKTLAEDPQNFDRILKLSHSLVSFDKDNVRFSVDSGVIDRLGKELVARHETAVSELVKNAYDADARFASLNFVNVDNIGGTLIIKDNGSGMTRDQLINGFMRISSTSKIHEPVSPLFKRKRAGKKGIGRFSTQRLGNKLTIITQTKDSPVALKIVVNWIKYLKDEDLFSISNKIEEIAKEREQGTTLIIEHLREWWSEAMIKRAYRYALDVIQPFPLSKPKISDNKATIDPGFNIQCLRDGRNIANKQTMFYQHALAEIEGYVDKDGNAFWLIKKSKVDAVTKRPVKLESSDNSRGEFSLLNGIKFKAYYFIYNANLIPKQAESYIREIIQEQGGIRMYRNGFRVLPYGEPNNDWLGLDASVRKRNILPVHGNSNFIGFVEIDDENNEFQELSSREGVFYNDAYVELVDFLYKSLTAAVIRVAGVRGRKTQTSQEGWEGKYSKSPKENEKTESEVILLTDGVKEKVYGSARKILSLYIGPGERGMMICEQSPENNYREALYLDLETKTTYRLKELLPLAFQRCFFETVREGNLYFLKLWTNKEKQDTAAVDIWYGNDNRLEKKLYPPVDVRTYAWDPSNHFIRRVGTDHLPVSLSTGNNRYFLSFDPIGLQDYSVENPPLQLYQYELKEDKYSLLDTIAPEFYLSGNGDYGLSPARGGWNLYHFPSGTKKLIDGKELGSPWFTTDNQAVIFEGAGIVWHYEIKTATLTSLVTFKEYQTSIANGQWEGFVTGKSAFAKQLVNLSEPLLISLYDAEKNKTGYCLWYNGKTEVIIPPTTKRIRSLNYNGSFTCFSWLEEDYNLPPRLVYKDLGTQGEKETETVVYQSNKQDTAILSLKREIIRYTNSDSIPLKGILYYPLGYDPSEKYPMVVHIYEKQNQQGNLYPYPSYYENLGFNIRLFLDKGYFVFLPDIVIQGKAGPGLDALDCVNHALDALAHNPLIDKSKIGLIGHSFGGYETDYIATRSSRFAAYVSGSGHSDIIWDANSFNYNFYAPDYVRVETNIYKFGKPFSSDKSLYFKNNPVYHAEKVSAPVLLWSGKEDQNVTADHTMAFYNALRRNRKEVVALFYKEEGHSLEQKRAQVDLTFRILDWFDFFLKENKECGWIKRGISRKDAR